MAHEQIVLRVLGERPARGQISRVRHGERRHHRVDAADEIMMLRRLAERRELVAAERDEHAARRKAKRLHGGAHVGDFIPAVAVDRLPCRPAQRDQANVGERRSAGRVERHRRRIRMGGIDQRGDALGAQVGGKTLGPAEPADPRRHRLLRRRGGAAGERERHGKRAAFGEPSRELPRFRRAAENEDASHGCA